MATHEGRCSIPTILRKIRQFCEQSLTLNNFLLFYLLSLFNILTNNNWEISRVCASLISSSTSKISRLLYFAVDKSDSKSKVCEGLQQRDVNGWCPLSCAPYIVAWYCSNFLVNILYSCLFFKKNLRESKMTFFFLLISQQPWPTLTRWENRKK